MFVPLSTSIELHFTAGNSIWLSLCTFFSTFFPFFLLTTSRLVYSTKSQNRKSHTANNCGKYNIKVQKWKAKYNELTVLLLSVPATLLYWLLLLIFRYNIPNVPLKRQKHRAEEKNFLSETTSRDNCSIKNIVQSLIIQLLIYFFPPSRGLSGFVVWWCLKHCFHRFSPFIGSRVRYVFTCMDYSLLPLIFFFAAADRRRCFSFSALRSVLSSCLFSSRWLRWLWLLWFHSRWACMLGSSHLSPSSLSQPPSPLLPSSSHRQIG